MGSGPGEVWSGPDETVEIRRRHQPLQFYFHEIELVDQEKFAFVTFLLPIRSGFMARGLLTTPR